jgi:hypothetical protein
MLKHDIPSKTVKRSKRFDYEPPEGGYSSGRKNKRDE